MHRFALVMALVSASAPCIAQENPVTNGGFETLDAEGNPVDWQLMGDCRITGDAHSGKYAVLLQRSSAEGLCGLNRVWEPDSGQQGTMLSQLKGGVRFWYKALDLAEGGNLAFYVIPMSARPFEDTGAPRAVFQIPTQHVGDGRWHEGVLKYDFSDNEKVKWVHISPRVRGDHGKLILDDITWHEKVGAVPAFAKASLREVEGREGDQCIVEAVVKNAGDQPIAAGYVTIEPPKGLSAADGARRGVQALKPDAMARVSWRVVGRRPDEGKIALTFRAGQHEASASVAYAPELEVVGLAAEHFILSPGKPASVALRLRNNGHAMVRSVVAELRPSSPLSTPLAARRQRLAFIRPQKEASIVWQVAGDRQTTGAVLQAFVKAANSAGGRAKATLIVGPPRVTVNRSAKSLATQVTAAYASIENGLIRLIFPKADYGYGIGILQRKVANQWQTVGMLPRLTRLVVQTRSGERSEHLVYASEVVDVPSPAAVGPDMLPQTLELAATLTDADGTRWTITETASVEPREDHVNIVVRAVPDRDARVLALDGPMFYAGEGAPAGTRRLDAIFPGLEWLVEGEDSSSALDIAADHPHRLRYVPHPHMVTIPLMSVRLDGPRTDATVVSLAWDHLRPYYANMNRPSAAFASPDRFNGRASTLMGLFAPSMPEHIGANRRTAHTPMKVGAGRPIELRCTLAALPADDETALKAVKRWFRRNGVPDPEPLPHGESLVEEVEFSMQAYLGPLWDEEQEKWWGSLHGPAIWRKATWPPAYLYDLRMCLDLGENDRVKRPVRERYDRVVQLSGLTPSADDEGFHFAGPAERLIAQAQSVAALIRRQEDDGSWRFSARIETQGVFKGMDYSELGPDRAAEVGTCARNAWQVLRFARMTGDENATQAGLKALAFMDRFRVPRAAQVWEVPVHTPDILASSDACEAYLEGYLLTGDRNYLDKAVYWAWSGLPFLYMWDVEGFEFLKYASIPVFGATWYRGSWFGRAVQWNGLRYAYALLQLAEYDDSLDWAKVARGVTVSAMYQQSTDEEDIGMWPDSISAIDKSKSGWIFAPRAILKNVYKIMGLQPTPVTSVVDAGPGKVRVTAAGRIKDVRFNAGKVSCKVTYAPPQTGYVVICGVSKPTEVMVNRTVAPEVQRPRAAEPPCWRYIAGPNFVELRLAASGDHEVTLSNVRYLAPQFTPRTATRIAFDFDSNAEGWIPAHDLTATSVSDGVLTTAVTGADPYLVRANCDIRADSVSRIRIRMALDPGMGNVAQFFWTTSDDPTMDEPKSRHFQVVADGEFHEAVVPLADHERWRGTITAIRLDPVAAEDKLGAVRVDYIRGE